MVSLKSHQDATVCYICRKIFINSLQKIKAREKLGANLRFNVPNENPVVFHNGPNYDYHLIIKELANESEEQFECLG